MSRRVPIVCSACGARSMIFRREESDTERLDILDCVCGETHTERYVSDSREVVTILCGPGVSSTVVTKPTWRLDRSTQ